MAPRHPGLSGRVRRRATDQHIARPEPESTLVAVDADALACQSLEPETGVPSLTHRERRRPQT